MIKNLKAFIAQNKDYVYECGSLTQSLYLKKSGIVPIGDYTHSKTGAQIDVFIHCDELSELLTNWTNNKPPIIHG